MTLTIDEIRDQIAKWEGWKKHRRVINPELEGIFPAWMRGNDLLLCGNHPIPYTLDEAAKLPEGWYYWINHCSVDKGGGFQETFICEAVRKKIAGRFDRLRTDGDTEIEARFRLRHAAMKAERGIA